MTDPLSLTNALTDANIGRQKAERIATEIFDLIHSNVTTKRGLKQAVSNLQHTVSISSNGCCCDAPGSSIGLRCPLAASWWC
jgi:hypothetical protein